MAGQSIGDRFVAAQHTIIGSDMSKSICKASTSEVLGPKKKHLDYLHSLTNEPNISIPELVDIIIERSKQPKWVVVFKSLITTHHLMNFGNEKFIQNLASRNSLFNLVNFLDKTGVQGYDMSSYIRRYSLYINQKAIAYRALAYDFTRIQRGKDGVLRTLDGDKLLKALPILQELLDALLEFNARPDELTNGVVNAAFMLLFKDLIRLFACYNEGMINLLEKYFTMKKNNCKEALEMYKKYLTRMTKVSEMLKVAEQVGIDKGDIPDLTTAPDSLLEALEQHLASLEGKKINSKSSAAAGVNTLNALNSSLQKTDENIQQSALNEEKNRLDAYKKQKELNQQDTNTSSITTANSTPFQQQPAAEPSNASSELLQIFAAPQTTIPANQAGNFAFPQTTPIQQQQPFGVQQQPQSFGMGMQQTQPFVSATNTSGKMFGFEQTPPVPQPNLFANSPFNATSTNSAQPLTGAGLLQPTRLGQETTLQFLPPSNPVDSKDLDSSLANVVANLHVGGQRANQDFEPKSEKRLTGGINYAPALTPSPLTFNSSPMHAMGMVPVAQPRMQMYGGGMVGMNTMMPMQQQQQAVYAVPYQQAYMQSQQPQMRALNPNNPFGSM